MILKTPAKDVECVGNKLKDLGFEIDCRIDQNTNDISAAVQETVNKLRTGATSMVFYYAGHGCCVG